MNARIRIPPVVAAILLAACLAGPAAAMVLATDWKENSLTGSPFSRAIISADGSKVLGGGSRAAVPHLGGGPALDRAARNGHRHDCRRE